MPKIGLVDDRTKSRESYKLLIEYPLLLMKKKDWEIIDIAPFNEIEEYHQWILENDISVLVIDEKLNEGLTINYLGHDVVSFLRQRFKSLPIYGVTQFARDEDLNKNYKNYTLIIKKSEFEDKREEYVNLFINTGSNFFDENKNRMHEVSELSEKIASGKFNSEDVQKLNSLQTYLSIPHTTENFSSKEMWLNELKMKLDIFSELIDEIEKDDLDIN